ncbi:MAG: hypothetical protein E7424_01070 [Ruminococcaceae bacterium]|nr:hypothetical protein [Oscillospiraceae bacterium]
MDCRNRRGFSAEKRIHRRMRSKETAFGGFLFGMGIWKVDSKGGTWRQSGGLSQPPWLFRRKANPPPYAKQRNRLWRFFVWYGYLEGGFERRHLAAVRTVATAVAFPQKSESTAGCEAKKPPLAIFLFGMGIWKVASKQDRGRFSALMDKDTEPAPVLPCALSCPAVALVFRWLCHFSQII